ncbi:MAG: ATP-binding protein, partial [bacterium]
ILSVLIQEMWKIVRKKQIEEALDNERERLAVTLRSIGDGVIATDTNGAVVLMNRVSEDLTGWKQADAIGKPLHEIFNIVNEITRELCENPVEKVLRIGGAIELPARTVMIAKDGTERMVADSGAPIRDRRSRIIGVVLVFRDVTEENRLHAEMQKITKLESLGVLAGGLAHDFNNMLTAITGNTGLAAINLELNKIEKAAENIADAETAAIRAKDLTQQLLTFARGGTPLRELMCLNDIIPETVTFALSGSRTRCNIDMSQDIWMVMADAGQISQVLHNLLLNADQAMPQGGIVNLSCSNITLNDNNGMLLAAGHYVKIDVADEGVGIPIEMQDKIFDPFFTTKQRGSGLGLASVFSIIRGHEGHVAVSSKVGIGSIFSVYLPAVLNAHPVKENHVDKQHNLSQMKILVMDDERIIAKVLTELLEGLGHQVGAFGDGKSAFNAWKYAQEINEPYEMGIFDLTVPGGMGGDETLKKIHKLDPEFMAVATSGYATDPIMTNYINHGFVGRLAKPYRLNEMVETINDIVKRKMKK